MPIVGWKSQHTDRVYQLEDYEEISREFPEAVLRAMVHKERTDDRHSGASITITAGLSCPRKTLIKRLLPIVVDPLSLWFMQRGTWLHESIGMALGESPNWITEEKDPEACVFSGRLFDTDMSCKIDARRVDFSQVIDWKFRKQTSMKFVDVMGKAKPDDAAQLNMQRLLIEQKEGREFPEMELYIWAIAETMARTKAEHMSESQVGEVRPGGGKFNVREIFSMLDLIMRAWKQEAADRGVSIDDVPLEVKEGLIRKLPMVGETMYNCKACKYYCEVKNECFEIEGGI